MLEMIVLRTCRANLAVFSAAFCLSLFSARAAAQDIDTQNANETRTTEATQVDQAGPIDQADQAETTGDESVGSTKTMEACFDAFEQSQVEMKNGDLLAASRLAADCSDGCPVEITQECQSIQAQVDKEMPTALLLARSVRGIDAQNVQVQIDGRAREDALGREISLNPGRHVIVFSRKDGWTETLELVVRAGEKRRQIRVVVPDAAPQVIPTPPRPKQSLQPWTIAAFSVGGAGLATAGAAGIVALSLRSRLDSDCEGNNCSQDEVDRRVQRIDTWLAVGDVALILGAVGAATGAGLLIYDASSRKNSRRAQISRARISIMPTARGASGLITAQF